ncbi:peptidoglycan-binding domain-containing protein [Sphingomonas sp. S2-65]|uniref:peptidoglycan-binding domain-containing protein n=1 Tax=Sphingomonas sp. S2-65 TaxID=2903960 RepID=UPI001F470A71|nr:peptidoglycan-binding domain-containing protein [Sphingomonas sp. S2-65]UYY59919.1 peptidoglycan-binding protein [Sphingomonas sp. S2-65]
MAIGATVGRSGINELADVLVVQHLLNRWLKVQGEPTLQADGDAGARTLAAITAFQTRVQQSSRPDGRIDPGGLTWNALSSWTPPSALLSGAAWWQANQGRYPNSARLDDLAPAFRKKVTAFLDALEGAGASVDIASTRRDLRRAQLMSHSWRIARGTLQPDDAPSILGVPIAWQHATPARSRAAAQEMADRFEIAFEPSLTSLHIEGRAIDMTISWAGTLRIRDHAGRLRSLTTPRSGNTNRDLHAVGASYGVLKLLSDPPHWSETGR